MAKGSLDSSLVDAVNANMGHDAVIADPADTPAVPVDEDSLDDGFETPGANQATGDKGDDGTDEPNGAPIEPDAQEPTKQPESDATPDDLAEFRATDLYAAAVGLGVPVGALERSYRSDPLGTVQRVRDMASARSAGGTKDTVSAPPIEAPGLALPTVESITKTLMEAGSFDEDQAKAITGVLAPMMDSLKSSAEAMKKSQQSAENSRKLQELSQVVSTAEAMFSKVDPDGSRFGYGKGDSLSLRSNDPKAFAHRSKVFELGRVLQSGGYSPTEAMQLAHNALNTERLRESARKDIEDRLGKTSATRTVPPGSARSQTKSPKESSLVTAINEKLGF